MTGVEEWRTLLGREELTDEDVAEFTRHLRNFIGQFLDDYLRDEFDPDEV